LKAARPDWIRDRKLNILLQMGLHKSPELPDIPLASDLLANPEDKLLIEMLVTTTAIGRPLADLRAHRRLASRHCDAPSMPQ
jgi:hypothetical protein